MANKYKRKTDGLDPERGNKLIIDREDLLPLYGPRMKQEDASEIIYTLGKWFCDPQGTPEPKLDNPFADAFLSVLIGRQKENVRHYFAQCEARSPSSGRDEEGQGEISRDKEDNKRTKVNKLNESKDEFSLGGAVGGLASPPPPVAEEVAGKVKVGNKWLTPEQVIAIYAPADYFGKGKEPADEDEDLFREYENGDEKAIKYFISYDVDYDLVPETIKDNDQATQLLDTLTRSCDEIGDKILGRAMWKFDCDKANDKLPQSLDTDDPQSVAKFFLARINRLREAMTILNARRDKAA